MSLASRRRATYLLGLYALGCTAALCRPAAAQDSGAAQLSRWIAAAPPAFAFVEKRHLAILSHPIVSKGIVTLQRHQTLLWHQTAPIDAAVTIGPGGIKSGAGHTGAMARAAVASLAGAVADIFFGRSRRLAKLFDVTTSNRRVVLVPKDKQFARVIARIELEGSDRLNKIKLIEENGDFTTISLTPAQTKPSSK